VKQAPSVTSSSSNSSAGVGSTTAAAAGGGATPQPQRVPDTAAAAKSDANGLRLKWNGFLGSISGKALSKLNDFRLKHYSTTALTKTREKPVAQIMLAASRAAGLGQLNRNTEDQIKKGVSGYRAEIEDMLFAYMQPLLERATAVPGEASPTALRTLGVADQSLLDVLQQQKVGKSLGNHLLIANELKAFADDDYYMVAFLLVAMMTSMAHGALKPLRDPVAADDIALDPQRRMHALFASLVFVLWHMNATRVKAKLAPLHDRLVLINNMMSKW
jgi:hypothetical protein